MELKVYKHNDSARSELMSVALENDLSIFDRKS